MTQIRPLSLADGPELLEFEMRNREYFARSVPDRGEEYFVGFEAGLEHLLVEQEAGTHLFFLIRDDDDRLVGRVNLVDISEGTANLGYRVAEDAAGRGHAQGAVRLVLEEARRHGIGLVKAMTTVDNPASRRVLVACGFTEVLGEPAQVEGHGGQLKDAAHYERAI